MQSTYCLLGDVHSDIRRKRAFTDLGFTGNDNQFVVSLMAKPP